MRSAVGADMRRASFHASGGVMPPGRTRRNEFTGFLAAYKSAAVFSLRNRPPHRIRCWRRCGRFRHCEQWRLPLPSAMLPMPRKPKATEQPVYCTYRATKIDDDVLPLVIAAAALARMTAQDYLSDVANEAASKALGRPPVERRTPPPHGKGRPRKS